MTERTKLIAQMAATIACHIAGKDVVVGAMHQISTGYRPDTACIREAVTIARAILKEAERTAEEGQHGPV